MRSCLQMKVLALYLPQFHAIPENDQWWGTGYTEWTAVRNAKSYYSGHKQPVVPLDNRYYDLSDPSGSTWQWQADLARKYSVYGFVIYHYWFKTGQQLLEKPMEILLSHPEIDIHYSICWANESWRRTWYSTREELLAEQVYGNEREWINHFHYLLPFFQDKRYIKINNKPVIHIYRSNDIIQLEAMKACWERLARQNGFSGVYLIAANTRQAIDERKCIDAHYNYEPNASREKVMSFWKRGREQLVNRWRALKHGHNIFHRYLDFPTTHSGKEIFRCNTELMSINGVPCYPGTFVGYDDTPRRQNKGTVYVVDPKDFGENLRQIQIRLDELGRGDDFVYITAWNEWGEGAHLEPDTNYGYAFLEQIKTACAIGGGNRT